jgi:hypothetical protein
MGALWSDEGNPGGACFRLETKSAIEVCEAFIDASFAPGEKGGLKVGKTKRGKGTKIMAVADRHGLPVSICIESATPHEVKLAHFHLSSGGGSRCAWALDWRQSVRFKQA